MQITRIVKTANKQNATKKMLHMKWKKERKKMHRNYLYILWASTQKKDISLLLNNKQQKCFMQVQYIFSFIWFTFITIWFGCFFKIHRTNSIWKEGKKTIHNMKKKWSILHSEWHNHLMNQFVACEPKLKINIIFWSDANTLPQDIKKTTLNLWVFIHKMYIFFTTDCKNNKCTRCQINNNITKMCYADRSIGWSLNI